MEQTEGSETMAYTIWMPGNYSEQSIQHSEHGESLKSRIVHVLSGSAEFYFIRNKQHTDIMFKQ
jgi:hypothetical protein